MVWLIVACLSLIIMNFVVSSRHRAQDNNGMSNVKQTGLGLEMYASDNNFRLPPGGVDWGPVLPYVKNVQIFLDPRDEVPTGSGGTKTFPSSYIFNPTAQADDAPETILAGDNVPDRHRNHEWFGTRADGATAFYPAKEWQPRLRQYVTAPMVPQALQAGPGGAKNDEDY
jgi:hypothetical protein